jgi:catechol 2,3-dioxygenase-like lactoylglutathione lyase family enzyme
VLDHVGVPVTDFARSMEFYERALAPLGYGLVMEVSGEQTGGSVGAGFGPKDRPQFWISTGRPVRDQVHVAFAAKDRAAVRAFYGAALKAGARDNGPPGLRPHYHQNYYGAFVLDRKRCTAHTMAVCAAALA